MRSFGDKLPCVSYWPPLAKHKFNLAKVGVVTKDDATHALEAMLLKMSESSDPEI